MVVFHFLLKHSFVSSNGYSNLKAVWIKEKRFLLLWIENCNKYQIIAISFGFLAFEALKF